MSQRTERIDELLRQEIGTILAREAKDPRIGFATITEVETEPDLRHARVWISVIGSEGERMETLIALQHAMHFVRRELGARLRLRRIPELHVRLDDSIERGTRVLHLIQELEEGRVPTDEEAVEPLPTPVRRLPHEGDAPLEPFSPELVIPEPDRDAVRRRPAPRRGDSSRGVSSRGGSSRAGTSRSGPTRSGNRPGRPSKGRGG